MRKLTLALLSGAYICISLMAALLVWRIGGGAGAGAATLIATLGLCYAVQGVVARASQAGELAGEIDAVREAHLLLASEIEKIQARLTDVVEHVAEDAMRRSDEIYSEVQLLEDIIQQMGERLETQLSLQVEKAEAEAASPRHSALLQTVRAALEAGRVDLYLQAVVSLPQRRTLYYESFSRLRDETGRVLMPAEFLSVAEPGGLVAAIDNLLLFRCVQIVRRLAGQDRKIGIFCNISLASLGDEEFFPQFMDVLGANRDLADSLIFELGQSAFEARGPLEARNMARLADLGFRFSIDKVSNLDINFLELARADVGFVKIAAPLLIEQLHDDDGRLILRSIPELDAADYAAVARRHGVELIAEKVESERQVVDILDLDIGHGQGHLFGEPRPIRDAVLAEAAPPSQFIQAALRRAN
ncbi:MAG TPA: EAL domain-containing protein [Caulobacteraceae bacterium]|jgi:cyclic-di-GMP phosphodiesterase TipF (flagellum assembly factor)